MTIQDLENKYPKRDIPAGAEVLRVSPSPTGFVHIGLIYMANICTRLAQSTKGVFILRIEDTDTAREVVGAKEGIVNMLNTFNIKYDEGLALSPASPGSGEEPLKEQMMQVGNYGPYIQSERKDIYDTCIEHLLSIGRAYRCYMSIEELALMREEQESNKVRPGVYGQYAKWRPDYIDSNGNVIKGNMERNNLSYPLNADGSIDETNCIIRFLSLGNENNKFAFHDEFLGDMMVPENDEDLILRKADGLPTYHLAHIVDDHYMRTTFVLRGNEWWSSLGKHIELWHAFEWDIPKYGHIVPINKQEEKADGGVTVRKLSKRKDKEADVQYFLNDGYMPEAVVAYVTRLANPSFDDWMMNKVKAGEEIDINDFEFNINELARGGRGPLIDMNKLNNISSEYFSYLNNEELYNMYLEWESAENAKFKSILESDSDYALQVLAIERPKKVKTENGNYTTVRPEKIRKDIYKMSQIHEQYYYFFDELYNEKRSSLQYEIGYPFSAGMAKQVGEILNSGIVQTPSALQAPSPSFGEGGHAIDIFDKVTTLEEWLEFMKSISAYLGYDKFANFMRDLRLALTLEERTPNLYDIMQVMGKERVLGRLG